MHRTVLAAAVAGSLAAIQVGRADELRAASAFTASQSRNMEPNLVNLDCSSGPRPEVRISTPPMNGTVRLEPITHIVHRAPGDAHAHCNGRRVDAVAVLYQSKEGYVGLDKTVIEADYHLGSVSQFTILIDVR